MKKKCTYKNNADITRRVEVRGYISNLGEEFCLRRESSERGMRANSLKQTGEGPCVGGRWWAANLESD